MSNENDGSHDSTRDKVENICRKDKNIKLLKGAIYWQNF